MNRNRRIYFKRILGVILGLSLCALLTTESEAFLDRFKRKAKDLKASVSKAVETAEQRVHQKRPDPEAEHQKLTQDYEELKKQFDNLAKDRENILAQTKHLLSVRGDLAAVQESYDWLTISVEKVMKRIQRIHAINRTIRRELLTSLEYYAQLEGVYEELLPKYDSLINENAQVSLALIEKIDSSPQYQSLLAKAESVKMANRKLQANAKELEVQMVKLQNESKKLLKRNEKQVKDIQGKKTQIAHLTTERDGLTAANKELSRELTALPKKFQRMAIENQKLLKETSDMHYNMGVFFAENRIVRRAIAEFQRALNFDPHNAKVHYNLGYLYAEVLEEHEKAMTHFQKYLDIDPQAKESEYLRSYLLVRDRLGDKIHKDRSRERRGFLLK